MLTINPIKYNAVANLYQTSARNNNYNYNMPKLKPLAADTVSFTGARNLNKSLLDAFNNAIVCEQVAQDASLAHSHLHNAIGESLGQYVYSQDNPDGVIEDIVTRVKSPESIREKVASMLEGAITGDISKVFNPNDGEKIKKALDDIVGTRIIMREAEEEESKKIIDALIPQVENGVLKIDKIECYVPKNNRKIPLAFSIKDMKRFKAVVNQKREEEHKPPIDIVITPSKTGYTAIHLDVNLSNSEYPAKNDKYKGEIQIIGTDVAKLKEVEDFCYKIKQSKEIKGGNVAYKPFVEYLNRFLNDPNHPNYRNDFAAYTQSAYAVQRAKQHDDDFMTDFLASNKLPTLQECAMQDKLPAALDFNQLARIKKCCDELYDLTK